MSFQNVCVFVSSSDNTKDVFNHVCKSFDKYWSDCSYNCYVGTNNESGLVCNDKFVPITSVESGWRSELLNQVINLPKNIEYVILFLDDFLILSQVDDVRVNEIVEQSVANNYDYVRLIPASRTVWESGIDEFKKVFNHNHKIGLISEKDPYYSSLQIALWKRAHLMTMLELSGDIWEFEHHKKNGAKHYAVSDPLVDYKHIVEKGKWIPGFDKQLKKIGVIRDHGVRDSHTWIFYVRMHVGRLRFYIFGYSIMRIKRYILGDMDIGI
jgi:hypothetical protein